MTQVTFPARCAVAVICGDNLVSQVYPAAVPIEVFIDDIVELLHDELKRRGTGILDGTIGYELQRADGSRLDVRKTLDELGIEDGCTLVLAPARPGDSFEPQYESLSTGLARIGRRLFDPVTAATAAHTALSILSVGMLAVLGLAVRNRMVDDSMAPAIVTVALGLGCAAAAGLVLRRWPVRTDLLFGFASPAIGLLSVGVASAAPGMIGAPHVFMAALTVIALTMGLVVSAGSHVTVAAVVATVAASACIIAGARMWQPVSAQVLGMCGLIGLLLLVTMAPTIALWSARIRPPQFGSITGRDLFRRSDGLPADAVAPVAEHEPSDGDESGARGVDPTPPGDQIAAAARQANGVLTGICVGAAALLPVATWATVQPGSPKATAAALLAGLFALIFVSRGRAFTDKRQGVALVCGAATAVCVGVAKYVLAAPSNADVVLYGGAAVLAGFAAAALVSGLLVPVTKFTPLVRMVVEWLELIAIVVALPLAAWVGGLFAWVRMR